MANGSSIVSIKSISYQQIGQLFRCSAIFNSNLRILKKNEFGIVWEIMVNLKTDYSCISFCMKWIQIVTNILSNDKK